MYMYDNTTTCTCTCTYIPKMTYSGELRSSELQPPHICSQKLRHAQIGSYCTLHSHLTNPAILVGP